MGKRLMNKGLMHRDSGAFFVFSMVIITAKVVLILGPIAEFGMGLGLAGVAGIRARYPFILLGLVARYSNEGFLREPFGFMGSGFVLLMAVTLVILDFLIQAEAGAPLVYDSIKLVIKASVGGIVFAGIFAGFSIPIGLAFGVMVALTSHFVGLKMAQEVNFEDVAAFSATVILLIVPLMAYIVLTGLLAFAIRNRTDNFADNRRYRNLR